MTNAKSIQAKSILANIDFAHPWFLIFILHAATLLCWSQHEFIGFVIFGVSASIKTLHATQTHPLSRWWSLPLICCYLLVPADDDVYRYLSEAEAAFMGINPYFVPPAQLLDQCTFAHLSNHPTWPAIYGPLFIETSALIWPIVQSVLAVKMVFVLAVGLCVLCLDRITQDRNSGDLFLWSPLILLESVGLAHMEILVALSALVVIHSVQSFDRWFKNSPTPSWQELLINSIPLAGALVMAVWLKWWALPLLPLFVRRRWWMAWIIFMGLSLVILVPYSSDLGALFHSLFHFGDLWTQGYPHLGLEVMFGSWTPVLLALYLGALCFSVTAVAGPIHEQIWQFFRLALWFSPTLHPWYWIMPLTCALCSKKTATFAILGGAALALHYPQFQADTTGHWESSAWVALPFFGLVLLSEWRHRHHLLRERGTWVERFSVVTPVLNEADNLKAIGPWIQQHRDVIRDWIVVDGGSNDDSVALARQFGAQVQIATTRGRGHQIHQGLQAAKEDWVVICHADSRYPQGFFKALQNRIATGPLLEGGAFRMVYRDIPKMGILLFLNDLKTRWLGISFGDQTQFIHRPSLQKRGGFPKLALMEDLELSLRWKGGHVCYLTNTLSITSARKWDRDGRIKNAWLIIQLLAAYLWQRHWHPPVDVSRLYQRYYRS